MREKVKGTEDREKEGEDAERKPKCLRSKMRQRRKRKLERD